MSFLESIYSTIPNLSCLTGSLLIVTVVCVLGFTGARLWLWTLSAAGALLFASASLWLWMALILFALVLNVRPVRRLLLSRPLLTVFKKSNFLPKISPTERTAIEAGSVWIEGELFSGKPNFQRLRTEGYPDLTDDERKFLDGPVEEICRMVVDWDVYVNKDLRSQAWDFLNENRFFGLIIPTEYGGLGFSASAHSAVIEKLASRSMPLSITVMVPNSLGPAELLLHYGTEEQKNHYLPRLADGREIPCFALTEQGAGSDAGSIKASGTVFKGVDGGLYLRLNWSKRYITLAAVSTILGLAFKPHDPDNLLGKGVAPGITCALIPTATDGVKVDGRHDPMGVPFYNSPIEGRDVIIPADSIIGGVVEAGNGWHMLVESLAAGRGISLPATAIGGCKFVARVAGAYATVRKQFGRSIGKFEGIEEPLARIGGFTYLLEAARRYTCGALDKGAKPAVVTAIAKYQFTELYRKVVNDGMDILAGNAIARGPRNLLAHSYTWTPIVIAAEGANILTRTLMIFGQGAIRCHPYIFREIQAVEAGDVAASDSALWGHVGHAMRNLFRSILLSLSRGYLGAAWWRGGPTARYYRRLAWASASFALLADIALLVFGGKIKRMEKITGRFADIFSWMYLATSVLRRFEAEGFRREDLPFLHWSMGHALAQLQEGFDGLFQNLKVFGLSSLVGGPIALWSRLNPLGRPPTDLLGTKIAIAMQTPGHQRDGLTADIFLPSNPEEALGRLERAFELTHRSAPVLARIKATVSTGQLATMDPQEQLAKAVDLDIVSEQEARLIREADEACNEAIRVDSFTSEEYRSATPPAPRNEARQPEFARSI